MWPEETTQPRRNSLAETLPSSDKKKPDRTKLRRWTDGVSTSTEEATSSETARRSRSRKSPRLPIPND